MTQHTAAAGTGPLHEHTLAGEQAAEDDMAIPRSEDTEDKGVNDHDETREQPTSEGQAEANREDDPPA
jgi:hypothetical protein